MGWLEGQVALITGGGTGIGRATALLFAEEGADVAINYSRSKQEAESTALEIEKKGRRCLAIRADVSIDHEVNAMVDKVVGALGGLDILVNNAGTTRTIPYKDLDAIRDEDWEKIFSVNLKGTFYCSRAAIRVMRERGGGQIINVSSIAGYLGWGSSIPYSVSKAAIINLTRALALSQGPEIRVNSVAPGVVKTRWTGVFEKDFERKHLEATPLKRVAEPEDVALAIFGLAINPYVTGKTLVVDGGRTLT
jgi:3-oxoacyl-[acyl-carrier protein] reductase